MEPAANGEAGDIDPATTSDGRETAAERTARQKREAEETRRAVDRENQRLSQRDPQAAALSGGDLQSERDPRAAAPGDGEGEERGESAACEPRCKDQDDQGPITGAGGGTSGPNPSSASAEKVGSSSSLVNTIVNLGEKFGLLKKTGNIQLGTVENGVNINDKSTSSQGNNNSAPQPRPKDKSSSPKANEGNLTISSTDAIFNTSIPPISPHDVVKTGPLDLGENKGKRKAIVLGDKSSSSLEDTFALSESLQSASEATESDIDNTRLSVEKDKNTAGEGGAGSATAEGATGGDNKAEDDKAKDEFVEPRSKGQKNADRLRRKKERERELEKEKGYHQSQSQKNFKPPNTNRKNSKRSSNAAKRQKNF